MSASPIAPALLDDHDKDLGARLRALRTERGLKLKDVAERTGMSIALISQIERGINSPSMRTLRLLCLALGIDGASLFTPTAAPAAPQDDPEQQFVVRAASSPPLRLGDSGVTKYRITPGSLSTLEGFLMELDPGATSDPNFLMQTGDKFAYVLSGRLEIFIDDQRFILEAGDTYGFSGNHAYRWQNAGEQKTQFLVVNSTHFYV